LKAGPGVIAVRARLRCPLLPHRGRLSQKRMQRRDHLRAFAHRRGDTLGG